MTILVLLYALLLQNCECLLNQAQADGFLGDPLLLKLVADQNEENVRAINCWQGTVEIVEHSQSKDGMKFKWRRHVHFAFDRRKQAWLWSNAWLEFSRTQGGNQLPSESLKLDGGMVKDNAYYQFSPYIPSSKQRKTVVIRPIEEYPGGLCVEFTPMEFFAADVDEAAYKRFGGLSVNHAMEESVISIESLGAVAGDRIVDRRDGSDHTFGK